MRPALVSAIFAALVATPALADAPVKAEPPPDAQKPALSIWRPGDSEATHLQSGLVCPAAFLSYRRVDLHYYDAFGLDVSCNYQAPDAVFTIYLTRRSGTSADDSMTEAKREFLLGRADWHPQPLSDTRSQDGDVAWRALIYADDAGRDGIWIADLHGWTLEYRITYAPAVEARIHADVAATTEAVIRSAGAHLALCSQTASPPRLGALITDAQAASKSAMMSAIGAAGATAAVNDIKGTSSTPLTWCVEEPVSGAKDLLFWRGVHDDGTDAATDRITVMTIDAPPELTVSSDAFSNLIDRQAARPPRWTASMSDADQTRFYGYFSDRPSPAALSALFEDILAGKAHPLSAYNARSKSISIDMPPEK
jgi:hypothetical protein